MTNPGPDTDTTIRETWEKEIFYRHRWGRHGENRATEEHDRLKPLWDKARPLDADSLKILDQIIALEICNWLLEDSILDLCRAIGSNMPVEKGIGHLASVTEERWDRVWAYYLSLRNWLPSEGRSGYGSLLKSCDPEGKTPRHVESMLGDRDELKELLVERFCLTLEFWLAGIAPDDSARAKAHRAAVEKIEEDIKKRDPDSMVMKALHLEGDGRLQPCHFKAFRRYDIILSSIGSGDWRSVIPRRGTDGFGRADTMEEYLGPVEKWAAGESAEGETGANVNSLLGERDDTKIFLAAFLVSILRSQQLTARIWAETGKPPQN